jgi:putative transposase
MYWYRRIGSRNSALNWENFMAVRHSNGTEKTIGEDVKFGTIALTVASNHMATFGPAVHHGYVEKWQDWPWSSAADYIERVSHKTVSKIWRQYPILDYGKRWDVD